MSRKAEIRKEIRQLKELILPEERERISSIIREQIEKLPEFEKARNILLYSALPDEVETQSFLKKWEGEKFIFLPVVKGDHLIIRRYVPGQLIKGSYGIDEPSIEQETAPEEIDMIIVPGMAFDYKKNRLGRGKGYYDKLLCRTAAFKIGICYKCQQLAELPTDEHDIPMDCIVSEAGIIKCNV